MLPYQDRPYILSCNRQQTQTALPAHQMPLRSVWTRHLAGQFQFAWQYRLYDRYTADRHIPCALRLLMDPFYPCKSTPACRPLIWQSKLDSVLWQRQKIPRPVQYSMYLRRPPTQISGWSYCWPTQAGHHWVSVFPPCPNTLPHRRSDLHNALCHYYQKCPCPAALRQTHRCLS